MAKTTTCPRCKAVLNLPDYAVGKPVRCPQCQTRFVASVSADAPEPAPIPVPPLSPSQLDELTSQADQPEPVGGPATAPQSRPTKPNPHLRVPNYGGVKFIGRLYEIVGWVCCIGGGVLFAGWLILGIITGGTDLESSSASSGAFWGGLKGGVIGSIVGGILVLAGVIQIGTGQIFYCIRDLARNSFYLWRL